VERRIALPSLEAEHPPPVPQRARRPRRRRWWISRVPWTIYGYVAGEVLRVFILGVLAISLLYTTLAAYQTVRSGIQLGFIWPLIVSTFAYPLYFSIPISLLFAVTLVMGRLVSDLEVTAFRTHGLSHVHVYAPVMLVGMGLAAVSFYLNGWLVPRIHYEKRNLQSFVLKQLESLGSGINRTILLPDGDGTLWVGAYNGSDLERVRVDISAGAESGLAPAIRERIPTHLPGKITILARSGKIEIQPDRQSVILNLRSVEVLIPEAVRGSAVANEIFHQKFAVTDNVLIPLAFHEKPPGTKDRTSPDLSRYIDRLCAEGNQLPAAGEGLALASFDETRENLASQKETSRRRIASAVTELHRRRAFAFSCLTFPLLGVALSLYLNRWSRIVPFFFANLTVIGLYYPLLMVAVALGERGFVPSLSLALPNVALVGLGIYWTRKVVKQ
jgi:lipopolysaccharide export LptBFGC system permease protein LptF